MPTAARHAARAELPRRISAPLRGLPGPAAALLAGGLAVFAMAVFAAAPLAAAAGALLSVYAGGYVAGALLVRAVDEGPTFAWAIIRTAAGLLLTTIGFLLSLVLSLPWFVGPGALVAAAVWLHGREAFSWPRTAVRFRRDDAATGLLAVILFSPVLITTFSMAPGDYPPVFYHADTPYFLEKVHALATSNAYPPESLSNLGGQRTYHFGIHAMTALISRLSGLLPHHALFLVVLPLLFTAVLAAAIAAAWHLSPVLPRSLAVPLLLISAPSLWSSFWGSLGPRLAAAVRSGTSSLDRIFGDPELWGIVSNQGQNVGGDFLVLASIAGIAAASSRGWRLPVFLIGSGLLVKTPIGIALLAGFALVGARDVLLRERLRSSRPMLAAAAVFFAISFAFWMLPWIESDFTVELYPLSHLRWLMAGGKLSGFAFDVLWVLLPVLIVLSAGIKDVDERSVSLFVMGVAPFLVVNATHMVELRAYQVGTDDDWIQVLRPAPVLFHAFALSLAARCWDRIGRRRQMAFLLAAALAILPVMVAAARYSIVVLRTPDNGHEFVDNRPLAAALATIPVRGSVIVTNDLRYPAQRFRRENRQMQIPALFGHQAFAVNYWYESYPFSPERRELQMLLERPEWTDAILAAARTYGWTHLLIRKDYAHPRPIPLEQVFENESYAVFQF